MALIEFLFGIVHKVHPKSYMIRVATAFLLIAFTAACGENTATQPVATQPVAAKSDAEMVESLRDAMTAVEDAVKGDVEQMHDIAVAMRRDRAQSDKAMHMAMMKRMFESLNSLLDQAVSLKAPPISNPDAARYVVAMVDDHRQWATLWQARIGALDSGDDQAADTFGKQLGQAMTQESLHSLMAYKAVNLEP
jgi:hypothetical protein